MSAVTTKEQTTATEKPKTGVQVVAKPATAKPKAKPKAKPNHITAIDPEVLADLGADFPAEFNAANETTQRAVVGYLNQFSGPWGLKASEEDAVLGILHALWPSEWPLTGEGIEKFRADERLGRMADSLFEDAGQTPIVEAVGKIAKELVAMFTAKTAKNVVASDLVEATTSSGEKIKVKPGTSQAEIDKLYAKTHAATKAAEQKETSSMSATATKPAKPAKPAKPKGIVTFTTNKRSIVAMTSDEAWAKSNPAIVKALWASDKVAVDIKKEKGSQPAHTLHMKPEQAQIVLTQMKKVGVKDKHVGLLEAKLAAK